MSGVPPKHNNRQPYTVFKDLEENKNYNDQTVD
jgi:hypothetical protein